MPASRKDRGGKGFRFPCIATHSGSGAMASDMAAATASSEAAAEGGFSPGHSPGGRDRDLPPGFDGGDPLAFKKYERDIQLWVFDTEVPKVKHGVRMLRTLTGPARAAAEEIPLEVLMTEEGSKAIMKKLREYFSPYLESALPRAFEEAVYSEMRKNKETIQEYIIRQDAAFKELKDEGVTLDDTVKGYIIFRHASLTQVQEDQVTTWTSGQYGREEVIKALRRLEKVHHDKAGKHFITAVDEGEDFHPEETFGSFVDDEDENYVWINDGDLEDIFEADLQEALATYQEVRKALRDQKVQRNTWKGRGKNKTFGKGKSGPFKGPSEAGSRRVHIDMLKLRTKCARCGQVGHWAKECTGTPDAHARRRDGEKDSTKTGFFVASEKVENAACFGLMGNSVYHFTLGDFIGRASNPPFIGIQTASHQGVVATAAQSGLIGEGALERLQGNMKDYGLKGSWTGKQAQARGVGGEVKVVGVIELPLGLGGVSGVLECTVVKEDIPLLLPIRLLRDLHAVVDLAKDQLIILGTHEIPMNQMPSGHASVKVLEFGPSGWTLPKDARDAGRRADQFHLCATHGSAMRGTSYHCAVNQAPSTRSHFVCHGDDAKADGDGGKGEGAANGDLRGSSSPTTLAYYGQEDASSRAALRRRQAGRCKGGRLAHRWLRCWIFASVLWRGTSIELNGGPAVKGLCAAHFQARTVRQDDQERGNLPRVAEVCQASAHASRQVHPSDQLLERGRQCSAAGGLVSGVPCSMEGGDNDSQVQGHAVREERDPSNGQSTQGDLGDAATGYMTPERNYQGSTTWTSPMASSPATPATPLPVGTMTVLCNCQLPAERMTVKKSGPTRGRHFFKCARKVCEFFKWDPQEIRCCSNRWRCRI